MPDGSVRGDHLVVVTGASGSTLQTYTITGKSDDDDDSLPYTVTATPDANTTVTPGTGNHY